MINTVVLTGRLTHDPELRYTQNGTAITNFGLAVNRVFKTKDGQDADFPRCIAFKKTAELIGNQRKGNLIGIEGRIQTRKYKNNQDQTVYVTEVVVNNLTFLESKSNNKNNVQGNSEGSNQDYQHNSSQSQNQSYGDPIDISDDDLPF